MTVSPAGRLRRKVSSFPGLAAILWFGSVPACANRPRTSEVSSTGHPGATASAPNAVLSGSPEPSSHSPSATATAGSPGELASGPLTRPDGTPLPQTEERPSVASPSFQTRVAALTEAIIKDDPALGRAAFFPVVAYEQVKAIANPSRDWQYRLVRAFEREVHEYHRMLGQNPERATLAGIDVNEAAARWMKPGSEGNRVGYFRVLRSRLRITAGDGKERSFEVTSMISWRGEWYVVHLHGFD